MNTVVNSIDYERIFLNIVPYKNMFTPYTVDYIGFENHICELSTARNNEVKVKDFGYKGTYGVTVITKINGNWEHDRELSTLCNSYKEAIEYIESLKTK